MFDRKKRAPEYESRQFHCLSHLSIASMQNNKTELGRSCSRCRDGDALFVSQFDRVAAFCGEPAELRKHVTARVSQPALPAVCEELVEYIQDEGVQSGLVEDVAAEDDWETSLALL